jgi:hypothetical protein
MKFPVFSLLAENFGFRDGFARDLPPPAASLQPLGPSREIRVTQLPPHTRAATGDDRDAARIDRIKIRRYHGLVIRAVLGAATGQYPVEWDGSQPYGKPSPSLLAPRPTPIPRDWTERPRTVSFPCRGFRR